LIALLKAIERMQDRIMPRFTDYNRKISSPTITVVCALLIFLVAFLTYMVPAALHGKLNAPPEIGDAHDYDAIGLQLSKGNGFSVNWDDPDYRAPYLQNNQDGRYDSLLSRHGDVSPTSYRPPLLPVLIALSLELFGREFWPIRVLNSFFMSVACVFAFAMLSRRFGVIPGLLCAGWLVHSWQLQQYSTMIMTEAPAVLVTALICWLLLSIVATRNWKAAVGLGAMTGVGYLTRGVFVLWMPVIVTAVYFLLSRPSRSWLSVSTFFPPALVMASFVAVSAPWMIRNFIVFGEPLGSMGPINLHAGYSDLALQTRGVWVSEPKFFDELDTEEFNKKSPIEHEIAVASYGRQRAREWIAKNPTKVPLLMYFKVRSLWRAQSRNHAVFLIFAGLGSLGYLLARPREALALLALLAACSMAVAITWDVGTGRFLLPVYPILAMLSALGVWAVIISATEGVIERIKLTK
jgi:4-amino-4-deoxy-L-arabinose transferase-like glycosyltransferase